MPAPSGYLITLPFVGARRQALWRYNGVKNTKTVVSVWVTKQTNKQTNKQTHNKQTKTNKQTNKLGRAPLNSSANTTKHEPTLPPLHAHNSSTHSNLTFSNTNPQPLPGPYRPSSPPLPAPPLMIHNARCVKVPLTRKECFSVTYVTPVGIWTASSPPSPPSLLGYGNVPCAPLLPSHPRAHCNTSASPLTS